MVIAFANQKGGVGKSTLCLSLAHYWASQGLKVRVVDTDTQRTLTNQRKDDLEEKPEAAAPFDIEFNKIDKFVAELPARSEGEELLLLDLPGCYDRSVIEAIRYSDYILVPYEYEDYVLEVTGMFATYLDIIFEKYPDKQRQAIFIPNKTKSNVGRKEDKEYWDEWKKIIEESVIVTPEVPNRVGMTRGCSLEFDENIRQIVTPCFEFITDIIINKQQPKPKEGNQ